MSFLCCGVKYSKNDPETYWCIETDINKPVQKKYVENHRVIKEIVDILTCKKNGCLKVKISRYGTFKGKKKLLEVENLSSKKAAIYIQETFNVRQRQPIVCPIQNVPIRKNNDFKYGKVIDSETQRARYLSEQDWASDYKIKCNVKTYFQN